MRTKAILVCTECDSRNYHISVNKYKDARMSLRKYCSACKKVTLHKETR